MPFKGVNLYILSIPLRLFTGLLDIGKVKSSQQVNYV